MAATKQMICVACGVALFFAATSASNAFVGDALYAKPGQASSSSPTTAPN